MKIRKSLFILPVGLAFFSCTDGIERPAARIRFNILPERVHVGEYNFPENTYRELAELVYLDSVMLPALRDAEIAVNAQSSKIFRDSILVTKTPGSYGDSEHDLVVWQADEEKAFRLVTALYDRLIQYYKRNKTGSVANDNEIASEVSEDETSTITDLNNQLANVERRLERWKNNPDSVVALEQEKQMILAQFSTAVEDQASTDDTNSSDENDGTPYVKYYDAERLGLIQMPQKRKPN